MSCASISELNIGIPPDSSSRMICNKIARVRSSFVFASTTLKSMPLKTICLTSASVM